ncbi:MAG: hypothetical protein JW908_09640 [Anaerolineales bacterium]|nr:hypothetical protein [Anaerolineales bacterium]
METKAKRILLANGTRLLREVVKRVINKTHGLEVVGEVTDINQLTDTFEKTQPDWIIYFLTAQNMLPDIIGPLLLNKPTLRILKIATNDGHMKIEWLGRRERYLDDSSLEEIADLLRSNLLNGEGNE